MKLSVLIPVLNEEKTVYKVINEVLAEKVDKVVIIDDGSTDGTSKILESLKNPKILVVTHSKNKGKGAAIKSGLEKLEDGYFIIQDADLEYDPKQFNLLLTKASPERVVYGSRLLVDKNTHAYTRTYLGNVLLTGVFNFLFGKHLTDTYTCYKLIPVDLAKSLNLTSKGFEIEAEITAKLAKKGVEIIEVPIDFKPRKYEEGKKIKARDAIIGLWTFLKIRFS